MQSSDFVMETPQVPHGCAPSQDLCTDILCGIPKTDLCLGVESYVGDMSIPNPQLHRTNANGIEAHASKHELSSPEQV